MVSGALVRGENVRAAGEDFQAGQLLVPAGSRLRPADLGAAAVAGYAAVAVARQPVVAIIPSGDEIRPVGAVLGPGEFTDSNSVMLAALAVQGAAIRPGHPVLLGHVKPGRSGYSPPGSAGQHEGTVPAIGVPGYPLAAAVIFDLLAAPLLGRLQGNLIPDRAPLAARLGCDWASPAHVEDWVPVSLTAAPDGLPTAVPSQGHGSGSVSRLAGADAWWRIPIGQGHFAQGDHIEVGRPAAPVGHLTPRRPYPKGVGQPLPGAGSGG